MNNQKTRIFIIICLVSFLLYMVYRILVFLYVIFPFGISWVGNIFLDNPMLPKTEYGEFPCRLVYEINGEQKVIEDTIVCEFDGYGQRSEAGQYRKWKTHMKNQKEELSSKQTGNADNNFVAITLLDLRNDDICDELGRKVLELYFYGGSGHYYMNDTLGFHDREAQDFSDVGYSYNAVDGTIGHSAFKADEAYERFKIKLISWEAAPPIQNEFK